MPTRYVIIDPLKGKDHIRLTLGRDVLDYFGDTSSPAVLLIETKLLINSVISDAH